MNVEVTPVSSTVDKIQQSVYYVTKSDKKSLLIHLLKDKAIESALVFTRTKHVADRITKELVKAGVKAAAIHGNKSQNARQNALNDFKGKKIRVLVATDIAARGIDVDSLSHVINYELPNVPETYVHRIGRTGRAGLSGVAMSFCDGEEKAYLKDIQKLIGIAVPVIEGHPYPMSHAEMTTKFEAPKKESHKKPSHHYGPGKSSAPNKAGNHWANKTNKSGGGNTSNPGGGNTGAPKKHHSGGGKSWGPKKPSGGNNFSY